MAHDFIRLPDDLPDAERQLMELIRKTLLAYEPLRATRPVLDVTINQGLVRLIGRVRTSAIKEIAELLVRCPEASIRLEGHTDSSGDANSNWQLSHARAYAVRDFLVDCGLPLHRFTCVGYGDTRAIDENQTEDGRWRNRRVEVRVIPPR